MSLVADPDGPNFGGDIRESLAAWAVAPALPMLACIVSLVSSAWVLPGLRNGIGGLFGFVGSVFALGFVATERLWYVEAWNDGFLSARVVWKTSWRHFPRLFRLGVLALVLGVVPYLLTVGVLTIGGVSASTSNTAAIVVAALCLDVALTFVVPAIVFSTTSALQAIEGGWRLLASNWPRNAAYCLLPALTLQFAARAIPAFAGTSSLAILGVLVAALVDLAFKGAITAYYRRLVPTPAAFASAIRIAAEHAAWRTSRPSLRESLLGFAYIRRH